MNTTYAQEKGGQRLHIVFTDGGTVGQPLCGKIVSGYRMTINVPCANACKNCLRLWNNENRLRKVYNQFLESLKI